MLCSKNLEDEFIFDIPVGNVYFKTPASIFNEEFNAVKNEVTKNTFPMSTEQFKKLLKTQFNQLDNVLLTLKKQKK